MFCWAPMAKYAPAATIATVTPSAATGRSQPSVREALLPGRPGVGPNRCQARRMALASPSSAAWKPAGTRSRRSVQAASAHAIATGRGRPSLA
jgi:hypothetical protein